MKKVNLITAVVSILSIILITGCVPDSPEKVFNKAALNSNLVTAYYTPKFFEEIFVRKRNNQLNIFKEKKNRKATAAEYLKYTLPNLEENILEIKALKKNDDSKELIEAALAYFEQANLILKNDYPKFAKMIDENQPEEKIKADIDKLFEANDTQMFAIYDRLAKATEQYAAKHDIPLIKR